MTENEVLNLLRTRHVKVGNGGNGEYAFMTHVRNDAAFNANRTFDAVAMGLWPSRGLVLHVYEVKCSRNDWLRELKEPAKAEAAGKIADKFSVVVADDTIVRKGELPETWGLLVVHGGKLVCVKDAPLLPTADLKRAVSRGFLVGLLRAGGAVPKAEADEIRIARAEGHQAGQEQAASLIQAAEERANRLANTIRRFERTSGIALADVEAVAERVRDVMRDEQRAEAARTQLLAARDRLIGAVESLTRIIDGP